MLKSSFTVKHSVRDRFIVASAAGYLLDVSFLELLVALNMPVLSAQIGAALLASAVLYQMNDKWVFVPAPLVNSRGAALRRYATLQWLPVILINALFLIEIRIVSPHQLVGSIMAIVLVLLPTALSAAVVWYLARRWTFTPVDVDSVPLF